MRKLVITLLIAACASAIYAQDKVVVDTLTIQAAIDACIALRNAAVAKDSAAMTDAAKMLKECDIHEFKFLSSINREDNLSSPGTRALDNNLIDSLLNGKILPVGPDAPHSQRGQTADGSIFSKTYRLKANETKSMVFPSSGYQELSVIALANGFITLKVRAMNNAAGFDKTFDDRDDVRAGRRERSMSFMLPKSPMSKVEVSVVNCTSEEFDIVVISN